MKKITKQMIVFFASILILSCGQPPERPASISSTIANDLVEVKQISDISESAQPEKTKSELELKNNKVIERILEQTTDENVKNEITLAKKDNKLHFVVLKGSIQIFREISSDEYNSAALDKSLLWNKTSLEKLKIKSFLAESESTKISDLEKEISATRKEILASDALKYLGEVKIKVGKLEKEKTDFGETKSTLNIVETNPAEATHILLISEKKAE